MTKANNSPLDFTELFRTAYIDFYSEEEDANYYMLINIGVRLEGYAPIQDGIEAYFNLTQEELKDDILEGQWDEEDFDEFEFDGEFEDKDDLAKQVEWDKVWGSIQASCDENTLKKEIASDEDIDIKEVSFKKRFSHDDLVRVWKEQEQKEDKPEGNDKLT